jgi:hypothetical protein
MENQGRVHSEPKIIGNAYQKVISHIKKYAENDLQVLFIGETGSGKELFARLYMNRSKRRGKKQTVNCAAWPEQLLRSEVFGHVKGAYTDAVVDRKGYLKTCDNGILFLDELGDASPEFQAAILRVSEMNSFNALGSDKEEKPDTLIIAATNRPNQIRQDLKMRFRIIPIPPLQKFDIPALSKHFLGKPLREDILKELMERQYPGNVRELESTCKELKARRGSDIFSKRESSLNISQGDFDYDRYEREVLTWEKYIDPLIQKYGLNFKYKYFKVGGITDVDIYNIAHSIYGEDLGQKIIEKIPTVTDVIENLNMGREEIHFYSKVIEDHVQETVSHHFILISLIMIFKECMAMLFKGESLPSLLEQIVEKCDRKTILKDEKPDLTYLLDSKYNDAVSWFKLHYLKYHQMKSSNNYEAAKEIGLSPEGLKTALQRVKRNIQKSEGKSKKED